MPVSISSFFFGPLGCMCVCGSFPLKDPRPYLEDLEVVASVGKEAAEEIREEVLPPAMAAVRTAARVQRVTHDAARVTGRVVGAPMRAAQALTGHRHEEPKAPEPMSATTLAGKALREAAEAAKEITEPLLTDLKTSSQTGSEQPGAPSALQGISGLVQPLLAEQGNGSKTTEHEAQTTPVFQSARQIVEEEGGSYGMHGKDSSTEQGRHHIRMPVRLPAPHLPQKEDVTKAAAATVGAVGGAAVGAVAGTVEGVRSQLRK